MFQGYILTFFAGALLGGFLVWAWLKKKHSAAPSRKDRALATAIEERQERKKERQAKIVQLLQERGQITNREVKALLGVAEATATNYLQDLENTGLIEQIGQQGRFVYYRLKAVPEEG